VHVAAVAEETMSEQRAYDEVLAETEEPITSSISAVVTSVPSEAPQVAPIPVAATDIFHNMAVDPNARKPKVGIVILVILALLAGVGASAYMLGIFK
jgi:hypothetical protein